MRPRLSLLLTVLCCVASASALAQRGVPQNGFPSWQERMVQVLVNRARADPTGEMKACLESAIRPPLVWSYNLNRAARFHSRNFAAAIGAGGSGYFQHDSSCDLVTNLNSVYPPNGTCDGAIACACQGGMLLAPGAGTPTFTRIGMFGTPGSGENIAYGYSSPAQVHSGWMNSAGHCSNLLAGHGALGVGWYNNHWTQNFGGGSAAGTLIAGAHSPQFSGNMPIEFRVNYYDPAGGPPGAQINVDGACSTMALERGSQTNGTWVHTATLTGTACRRYFFIFADAAGDTVYLPETGSYGVGESLATCPDWEPGTPQGCGPLDKFPTLATAAAATPDPVTGATTQVSVRGADDNGEAALVYTWSATGPFGVDFSPNGTHAARDATATFGRVGSYALTAAIRDASNQVVTSTVTVTVVQTPTGVAVTPGTAAVATSATRQFAAVGTDQFGQPLAPMPALAWSVSGGGTINGAGLFTAGAMAGGPHSVTAATGAVSGTAQVIVGAGDPPIITQPAQANPNPVTGTNTQVSVLATDDGGDEAIIYVWSATGPEPVGFGASGTNAAKTATATFTRAGTYQLTATAQDAHGLSTQSTVQVAVVQMPGALVVTPLQATARPDAKAQFLARARDQFGVLIQPPPAYAWSVSGGGTIDNQGLFSAGAVSGGPHTVTATASTLGGTAQVVVTPQDPLPLVVALAQPQQGARLLGTVKLAAQTNDSPRVARVRFTVDDVEVGDAQLAPYELGWDTTTHPDGERRLRAGAVDASGQTTWSPEVTVHLGNSAQDTTAPHVSISSPQPGPLSGTVFVVADATDDRGVASVMFSVDGVAFETLTQPPWQASFDASTYAAGEHLLTVSARDAAGNEGRAEVAFTTGSGGGGCGCAGGGAAGGGMAALWMLAAVAALRAGRGPKATAARGSITVARGRLPVSPFPHRLFALALVLVVPVLACEKLELSRDRPYPCDPERPAGADNGVAQCPGQMVCGLDRRCALPWGDQPLPVQAPETLEVRRVSPHPLPGDLLAVDVSPAEILTIGRYQLHRELGVLAHQRGLQVWIHQSLFSSGILLGKFLTPVDISAPVGTIDFLTATPGGVWRHSNGEMAYFPISEQLKLEAAPSEAAPSSDGICVDCGECAEDCWSTAVEAGTAYDVAEAGEKAVRAHSVGAGRVVLLHDSSTTLVEELPTATRFQELLPERVDDAAGLSRPGCGTSILVAQLGKIWEVMPPPDNKAPGSLRPVTILNSALQTTSLGDVVGLRTAEPASVLSVEDHGKSPAIRLLERIERAGPETPCAAQELIELWPQACPVCPEGLEMLAVRPSASPFPAVEARCAAGEAQAVYVTFGPAEAPEGGFSCEPPRPYASVFGAANAPLDGPARLSSSARSSAVFAADRRLWKGPDLSSARSLLTLEHAADALLEVEGVRAFAGGLSYSEHDQVGLVPGRAGVTPQDTILREVSGTADWAVARTGAIRQASVSEGKLSWRNIALPPVASPPMIHPRAGLGKTRDGRAFAWVSSGDALMAAPMPAKTSTGAPPATLTFRAQVGSAQDPVRAAVFPAPPPDAPFEVEGYALTTSRLVALRGGLDGFWATTDLTPPSCALTDLFEQGGFARAVCGDGRVFSLPNRVQLGDPLPGVDAVGALCGDAYALAFGVMHRLEPQAQGPARWAKVSNQPLQDELDRERSLADARLRPLGPGSLYLTTGTGSVLALHHPGGCP